jgi:hypothetical protein
MDALLTHLIDRLLRHEDIAAETLQASAAEESAFQRQLALALVDHPNPQSSADKIPPASPFQKLQASTAWRSDPFPSPGNLLVISAPQESDLRILALEAQRYVRQFDPWGKSLGRHELDFDQSNPITRLTSSIDRDGRVYYLGYSQMGPFVDLFDAMFRRRLRYPAADPPSHQIMDAQMADLDDDGQPEIYIGFAEPSEVHCVDLQGRLRWSQPSTPGTLALVPYKLPRQPVLLALRDGQGVFPIEADGRPSTSNIPLQRPLYALTGGSATIHRPSQFVGLCYTLEGRSIAIGLDAQLREAWSYGLPAGVYRSQVHGPTWFALFEREVGYWIMAGPDGSTHLIRDEGSFHDSIQLGEHVAGFAAHPLGKIGRIYIVGENGIVALDIQPPNLNPR